MANGGGAGGQFAEIDYRTTDWFAGTAELDSSNTVTTTTSADPGIYTLLALVLDGQGDDTWLWIDVAVGADGPFLYSNGRILQTDGSLDPADTTLAPSFSADLVEADGTAGLTVANLAIADDASASPAICGNDAGVGFDLGPLADGWCGRGDVVGQRVVFDGELR